MKRTAFVRKTPMKSGSLNQNSTFKLARTPIKKKAPRNAAGAAERRYMGYVAALGCALCRRLGYGATPAVVHHQRTGQGKMRASHYRTVPLCPIHHDSNDGVHGMGRDEFEARYGVSEVELVDETRALLAVHIPDGE